MYIQVLQNKNGAYYWELIALNQEVLAVSESYSSKAKCVKTVKSVAKQLNFNYDPSTLNWEMNNDTVG